MAPPQRRQTERRHKSTHPWLTLHGRRRQHRRLGESGSASTPLDWHPPHLLAIILAILILCLADAHNTLQLLVSGAQEINLLMDFLIRKDPRLFLMVKLGITGACLVVLVAYQHFVIFNRLRIRHILYSIFGLYLGLIGYELAIWPGQHLAFFLIPMQG